MGKAKGKKGQLEWAILFNSSPNHALKPTFSPLLRNAKNAA